MGFTKLWMFSLAAFFVALTGTTWGQTITREFACPKVRVTHVVNFTDQAYPYNSAKRPGWKAYPSAVIGEEESIPSELVKVESIGGTTVMTCAATYGKQRLVLSRAYAQSDVPACSIKPGTNGFTCTVRDTSPVATTTNPTPISNTGAAEVSNVK